MARTIGRLTALSVARAKTKGRHADGGGLYLQVSASGTKSWIYRFMLSGKLREMGLGPYPTFGLADARARAVECRKQTSDDIDPIETRKAVRAAEKLGVEQSKTFR